MCRIEFYDRKQLLKKFWNHFGPPCEAKPIKTSIFWYRSCKSHSTCRIYLLNRLKLLSFVRWTRIYVFQNKLSERKRKKDGIWKKWRFSIPGFFHFLPSTEFFPLHISWTNYIPKDVSWDKEFVVKKLASRRRPSPAFARKYVFFEKRDF